MSIHEGNHTKPLEMLHYKYSHQIFITAFLIGLTNSRKFPLINQQVALTGVKIVSSMKVRIIIKISQLEELYYYIILLQLNTCMQQGFKSLVFHWDPGSSCSQVFNYMVRESDSSYEVIVVDNVAKWKQYQTEVERN